MKAVATPARGRAPSWFWPALLLIFALECAWFGWFLVEPLPNAGNAGGNGLKRWIFLTRSVPQLMVEGLTFRDSYFGLAWLELSHVGNLPQRLPIVLAAGLIGGAALGLGGLVLRGLELENGLTASERVPLAFVVGASCLGVVTLVLGRWGLLHPWPVRVGLLLPAALEGVFLVRRRAMRRAPTEPRVSPWLRLALSAAAGPFVAAMLLGAMLPTVDFDAIEYHLQGPKEYYQNGRITFLPHNVYTSMPFGVEMLHLLGMVVRDDWWSGALAGQLLIAVYALAAAALVAQTARRWGSPRAGWWAAAVYLTTPWVYRLGVLPYVEGPLCAYHAALFWAAGRAWGEPDPAVGRRFWALAGLLAGGAMACKYPALISAVVPFGLIALLDAARRSSPAAVLAYCLGWAVIMTPWLVKNVVDTGNPVYPLGYNVFGGREWDPASDAKWANAHGPKPVQAGLLWNSVVDVAGRSDWQSSLYVALAPLAFLRKGSRRFAGRLSAYLAYLFLTWWLFTHRLDRFWLPILPGLAVLAGLGADWSDRRAWSVVLGLFVTLSVVTNASYTSTALTGLNEWTAELGDLRKRVPRMANPGLAQLDAALPRGAKVLLAGQAAVFHLDRPVVYNTVFDREIFETLAKGKTPAQVAEGLRALGVDYVYVDWQSIERFRSPFNYGFTDFITAAEFDRLVRAGVLDRPEPLGAQGELYRVRTGRPS